MTDAVLEPEGLSLGRQNVAILPPDHFDAAHFLIRRAGTLEQRLEPRCARGHADEAHMDVRRPKRLLPVVRSVLTDVAQLGSTRGHALLELLGEAVEGILR